MPPSRSRPAPPWSRRRDAVRLVLTGVTFHTAARVAIVVGTILTAITQGSVIIGGDATATTSVRVACNYAIPYVVASIGYLAPSRTQDTP